MRVFARLCLWLLLFVPHFFLSAQTFAQPLPAVLADQIQATYVRLSDLGFRFQQETYVALLEKKVQKNAQAQFKKPGKFFISYEGLRGRRYLSNGKMLWVFEQGDSQVQSTSLEDEAVPSEALSFLGGLGDLKKDFFVKAVDPKIWQGLDVQKKSLNWLQLVPRQASSRIKYLVMGFDPQTFLASELFLYNQSGNQTHYILSDIKTNQDIADEVFELK